MCLKASGKQPGSLQQTNKQMKIIVTYASAGAGHFKAAEALYNYLKEHYPQAELKLLDVLDMSCPIFAFFYRWGYSFLIRRAPFLWQVAFFLTDFKLSRFFTRAVAVVINKMNTGGFIRFLIKENPDVLISTHFLPSELAARLKRKGKIRSKLITQITDFGVHPFWVSKGTDIYIVASLLGKEQLKGFGVREDTIKELGIPVGSKFLKKYEKQELRKKLGTDLQKFTVLAITGSFGIGPLEKIADILHEDIQVLVVCANNKKLYSRLTKRNLENVKVFGFIHNAEELMAASDLIITKPGGLSTVESLTMDLFPIFISPIPGQETGNIKALAFEGVGFYPKNISQLKDIVMDFKEHPDKLEFARQAVKKMKRPDCLRGICNVVCEGSAGASC